MPRPLHTIAREIHTDWHDPYYRAVPHMYAMLELTSLADPCGTDSAKNIVLYFLSNARTWRGPVARRVKDELRDMCEATMDT